MTIQNQKMKNPSIPFIIKLQLVEMDMQINNGVLCLATFL